MKSFKQYLKIQEQNTFGKHNDFATSAFVPSDWTGSESRPDKNLPFLPSLDIKIPEITRSAKIYRIELNKNPIEILLIDGTKIFLSIDEFNRIQNKPEIGKIMTVSFQRKESDQSENPSKITSIKIT